MPRKTSSTHKLENGLAGWMADGYRDGEPYPPALSYYAHSPTYSVRMGSHVYNDVNQDLSKPGIWIPADAISARLTYWWSMYTDEDGVAEYDFLELRIEGPYGTEVLDRKTNLDGPEGVWRQESFDMSEYIGQTIEIEFRARTDFSNPTAFYIDDVSLWVCWPCE